MPLSEFQQPQQYVEDSIFYDFHKSFLPGIIMVGDRIKKKKTQTSTGYRKKTNTRACDW